MAKIVGISLYSRNFTTTSRFYREIGVVSEENRPSGLKHNEIHPFSGDPVLQLGKASDEHPKDALMIEVNSLNGVFSILDRYGLKHDKVYDLCRERFIYTTDPDGRALMLIEKK